MKKTNNIIIYFISIVIILITSCKDEWLELDPEARYIADAYYSSEEQVWYALNGAYAYLRYNYTANLPNMSLKWHDGVFLSNAMSDDAIPGGADEGDSPDLQKLDWFGAGPTDPAVTYLWASRFFGIDRCNSVINADKVSSTNVTAYKAEAKFIRAYFYFELLRFYGNPPLVLTGYSSTKELETNATQEEIFAQIVKDLKDAITLLPERSVRLENPASLYRVTKGAAKTLLGKVYLYMASPYYNLGTEYYDSSMIQLAEVIASDEYDLMPIYDRIFKFENEFCEESIFEIEYSSHGSPEGWWDGMQGSGNVMIRYCSPRFRDNPDTNMGPGWGWENPTQDLADAFMNENDTNRFNACILTIDTIVAWSGSMDGDPAFNGYRWSMKKAGWQDEWNSDNVAWSYGVNERILRYSDVLLMAAECIINGAADSTKLGADELVNIVRRRVGLVDKSGVDMDDIMIERRLEFALEGENRLFDLIRWEKAVEKLSGLGFDATKLPVFPTPYTDVVNGNVE